MEPGNLRLLETGNANVFAFQRIKGRDRVTVAVNLTEKPARLRLPGGKKLALKGWGWSFTTAR
jgi:hypothetical protein